MEQCCTDKAHLLWEEQTRNDWLHLPRMITSEHYMHLKQVNPSESLPLTMPFFPRTSISSLKILTTKRIICFRQISKIRKKTPKFADFLHFKEFSFRFVEDKYKCTDFLLTDICSIPLPTYVLLLMILPQQDFRVKCQPGQSLRYVWLASGGSTAGYTSPRRNHLS